MKREALRLARKVFEKRRISPEEFFEAIRAIGVHSDFRRFKPQIEAAYDRQSRRFKSWARAGMLYRKWATSVADTADDWIISGSRAKHQRNQLDVVGNPAAFQAFKPPAIERTFL